MNNPKVFNDCIHGHIELDPLCVAIIDTPEFQRLRFIKQIGACYFVYPGASHNRFEHSLGVCFLAGELVQTLRQKQPELEIDDKDVLCVKIAGLCNNLGRGPFSRMYDDVFLPRFSQSTKHDRINAKVFRYLIEQNNLKEKFKENNLEEADIQFIEEQISGPSQKEEGNEEYESRQNKKFLFEIVANRKNGIDVERWDYLARDCCMLGIQNSFDYKRFLKYVRVITVKGEQLIGTRDKQSTDLYDMFYTRKKLMERAYQHKVCNLIELMITEALVEADEVLTFKGSDGKDHRLSEARGDMMAFMQLTDDVIFSRILHSDDTGLASAKNIIRRILKRDFYPLVGEAVSQEGQVHEKDDKEQLKESILKACCCNDETGGFMKGNPQRSQPLVENNMIVIDIVNTDYGMKKDDPIEKVYFYSKADPDVGRKIPKEQVSLTLPQRFDDQRIRVYTKTNEKNTVEKIKHLFKRWCEKNKFTI